MSNPYGLDGPRTLNIYQTSACNQRCPFCKRQTGQAPKAKDFTVALLRRVLDTFPTVKTACVAGFGEPLMSPELPEVAAELKRRGVWASLVTNGTLIGKASAKSPELFGSFGAVNISLNAAIRKEHEDQTGLFGGWSAALAGARWLVASGVPVSFSFVIGNSNVGSVPDYVTLARDFGVKAVLHNVLPHSVDDAAMGWFRGEVIRPGTDQERYLESCKQGVALEVVTHWPEPVTPDEPPERSVCAGPFYSLGVDGDGNCSVCPRCWGPHETGVVFEGRGTWRATEFNGMRQAVLDMAGLDLLCRNCFGHKRA